MRTTTLLLSVACVCLPAAARADQPVSLERTLVRAAPDVLKYCRDHGYKNVGVLKFLVHKAGQDKLSDNAGTMNRTVARRLELGLILANDATNPLGIIGDASDVAAQTPGANHLTRDGRAKLFEPQYPLAWGQGRVTPDAFITGLIGVSDDLKTLTIKLLVFDRAAATLQPLGKDLVAVNDPRKLSEMGESFSRGGFDGGTVEPAGNARPNADPIELATRVKHNEAKSPAQDASAPVALEVLYDDRPVPFEVAAGRVSIPDPAEGQRVSFRLKRNPSAAGTLACVLKVNGLNTLYREKSPDLQCRKWLLMPNNAAVQVGGFQVNETTSETFRVLSKAESKAREVDYGSDVGTITLTVFGELKGRPARADLSEETQLAKVLEKAEVPARKADNFNALSAQLLEDAPRNVIDAGAKKGNKIEVVKFTADPTPLMSLTVVYYKP